MQKEKAKFKSDIRSRCFQFSLSIISLCDTLPNKRVSSIITDQLIRSATSVGANLTEAKASSSRVEYKKFYEIALKSGHETIYWLELLRETHLTDTEKVGLAHQEANEIVKMLAAGVIKLKSKTL